MDVSRYAVKSHIKLDCSYQRAIVSYEKQYNDIIEKLERTERYSEIIDLRMQIMSIKKNLDRLKN